MKTLKCDLCEHEAQGETFEAWMEALRPYYGETRVVGLVVRIVLNKRIERIFSKIKTFRCYVGTFLLRVQDYERCLETSFVISNIFTTALPPKTAFSASSAMMLRLFSGSCRFLPLI